MVEMWLTWVDLLWVFRQMAWAIALCWIDGFLVAHDVGLWNSVATTGALGCQWLAWMMMSEELISDSWLFAWIG